MSIRELREDLITAELEMDAAAKQMHRANVELIRAEEVYAARRGRYEAMKARVTVPNPGAEHE
jgi:hypothetical protein